MKKVLSRIYIIFDYIIFLSTLLYSILLFTNFGFSDFLFDNALVFYILIGLYISFTSIAGIIRAKKIDKQFNSQLPATCFLPMYIVNILSIFCLIFPVKQTLFFLSEKKYKTSALCFLISLIIILLISGQVKWQKMILINQQHSRFIKYYLCVTNPIKCCLVILFLQAYTLPGI